MPIPTEKTIIPKENLTDEEKKLLELVDKEKDNIIDLLKKLIEIDSRTYDSTIYSDLNQIFNFVENYLSNYGFQIKKYYAPHKDKSGKIHEDKKWPNLICVYNGNEGEEGKILQLNGHLDVVPFTEENWKEGTHPLKPTEMDGRLYGRGSVDMKSGVACAISAMRIFKQAAIDFKGKLQLWLVPDEEIDGHYGARFMVKNHFDGVNADATIIGESTGQPPIQSPVIIIGEKGMQWLRLIFKGASGHGSMPKKRSNSINKVNRFIANIKKLKLPKVKSPISPFYVLKSLLSRYKIKDLFKIVKQAAEEEPDPFDEDGVSLSAFFNSTLSFNMIKAGEKVNVIPDTCELCLDFRVLPGITTQDIFDSLADYATKLRFRIEFPEGYKNKQKYSKKFKKIKDRPIDIQVEIITSHASTFEDPNSPPCQLMKKTFETIYRKNAIFFFAPGGTDATHMRNSGMKNCIVFGPSGFNAHSSNENVIIDDVINVTKTYLLYIYRFLKEGK
ncbi:MAG: M20 family metallopeptidase [Promethearchaeota archaeon]